MRCVGSQIEGRHFNTKLHAGTQQAEVVVMTVRLENFFTMKLHRWNTTSGSRQDDYVLYFLTPRVWRMPSWGTPSRLDIRAHVAETARLGFY